MSLKRIERSKEGRSKVQSLDKRLSVSNWRELESEGKVIWRVVWENDCESGWERGVGRVIGKRLGECEKVQRAV